jgi:hypothetical protein
LDEDQERWLAPQWAINGMESALDASLAQVR